MTIPAFFDVETRDGHVPLHASDFPRIARYVIVKSGLSLKRGTVLGRVGVTDDDAATVWTVVTAAATDGSKVARAILVEDVDATAAAAPGRAEFAGHFNRDALTVGAGLTIAAVRDELRLSGIHLT